MMIIKTSGVPCARSDAIPMALRVPSIAARETFESNASVTGQQHNGLPGLVLQSLEGVFAYLRKRDDRNRAGNAHANGSPVRKFRTFCFASRNT